MTARLGDSAALIAKGTAVEIPVTYTCSTDASWGGIELFVTERVPGQRTAQGGSSAFGLVCDGTEHLAAVTVPSTNGIAFHRGTAIVTGSLYAADQYGYATHVPLSGSVDVRN